MVYSLPAPHDSPLMLPPVQAASCWMLIFDPDGQIHHYQRWTVSHLLLPQQSAGNHRQAGRREKSHMKVSGQTVHGSFTVLMPLMPTPQRVGNNTSYFITHIFLRTSRVDLISTWTTSSPCKASICLGLLCLSLLPCPSFPKSPSPQLNTSPVSVRAKECPSDPQEVTSWVTTYPVHKSES